MAGLVETYRGVAYPWLCDSMGHMNTQHYAAMYDSAVFHLLAMISAAPEEMATRKLGWADVRQVIEYRKEVRSGALLVIRSGVVRIGNKSVEHRHEMHGAFGDVLHSTLEGVTAFFDLEKRAAAPLEDWIREKASALLLPPAP